MIISSSESGKRRPDLSAREDVQLQIDSLLTAVMVHFSLALDADPRSPNDQQRHEDPQCEEAIHQLRICSRRSQAALSVYDHILPKKPARWLRRQLKRIRQAAGICRDLDVLKERFFKYQQKRHGSRKEARRLVGCLESERQQAMGPLKSLHSKLILSGEFARHKAVLLDELDSQLSDGPTVNSFEQWSRDRLRHISCRFLKAGRTPLKQLPEIHEFRIRAKQLRYALEILANQLSQNSICEINLTLVKLQKLLGELNDQAFAKQQIQSLKKAADSKQRKYLKIQLTLTRQQLKQSKLQLTELWDSATRKRLKYHLETLISSENNELNPPPVPE
jgi:CHAD domain-containing protein